MFFLVLLTFSYCIRYSQNPEHPYLVAVRNGVGGRVGGWDRIIVFFCPPPSWLYALVPSHTGFWVHSGWYQRKSVHLLVLLFAVAVLCFLILTSLIFLVKQKLFVNFLPISDILPKICSKNSSKSNRML